MSHSNAPSARRHLLAVFAALLAATCTLVGSSTVAIAEEPELIEQPEAPGDLVHFSIDGKRVVLSDYVPVPGAKLPPVPRLAGPVVLIFGAHWCAPCKEVVGALDAQRKDVEAAGIHVFYVHVDDVDRSKGLDNDAIRDKAREMASDAMYEGITVLLGGDQQEMRAWMGDDEADALPGVVLIKENGEILTRTGASDFAAALELLLGQTSE